MKASLVVCAFSLVVLVSGMEASPVGDHPEGSTFDESFFVPPVTVRADRHRRVTCDLLSFSSRWGSFGHSVCAAHCIAMMQGYRGGYCDDHGVCNCRK